MQTLATHRGLLGVSAVGLIANVPSLTWSQTHLYLWALFVKIPCPELHRKDESQLDFLLGLAWK